jgi:pectin methylesterase-like acyl-CoA thioesterase
MARPTSSAVPGGTITVSDTVNGVTNPSFATGTLVASTGTSEYNYYTFNVTFTNLTSAAQQQTIAASYSGDLNNAPSSGITTLTVASGAIYYSSNYTSVQAAIDAAPPDSTVIIAPGFYNASLIVNKPLTIIGEKDVPVFGGGASGIYLTLLSGASGSTVMGIEITNFNEGILVSNASNCRIYSNIMTSIGSNGILLEGNNARNDVIYNNIFQDVPTPINLTASGSGNTIYGNIITSQASVTLNVGADGNSI